MSIAATRVVNACVLLEIDGFSVLTDPCFRAPRGWRFSERPGLAVEELPRLDAIVVGHRVPDHWQPSVLRRYHYRETTPIFVPAKHMVRTARRAGFPNAELLRWGDRRTVGGLTIDCLPGEGDGGMRTNAYRIASDTSSVLVATEARRVLPEEPVDVAVLPIDGAELLGRRLVMNATEAVEAARQRGATLLPIHYSLTPVPPIFRCPSGIEELPPDVDVLDPGVRTVLPVARRHA